MNAGTRQGMLLIFIFLLMPINYWLKWMSWFETLFLCAIGSLIVKMADIEEELIRIEEAIRLRK